MFGIITDKFIIKIHQVFDELGYHEKKKLSYEEFEKCAVNTLCHAKDLIDGINAVRMFQYCLKKWDLIESIFAKKLHIWNQIPFVGEALISTVSDEEAAGTYFITNGITKKFKNLFITSVAFENELYSFDVKGGKFIINDNYYLKFPVMSDVKMKLFDKHDNLLCNIVLSDKLGIFLEKNKTKFELITSEDGFIDVVSAKYASTIGRDLRYATDEIIADINWDILEKGSELGAAQLRCYKEVSENDLFILFAFATATFLIFRRVMEARRATQIMMINNLWN